MKQGQKGTKHDRVKKSVEVHGNPMFGMRTHHVAVEFYTPREAHENKMPMYTKLNKRG